MQQAFLEINGVRTKVSSWGRWVEESAGNTKDIVIIIPGNPGVTSFYNLFAKNLYDKLEIPVWCIGHAGHNIQKNAIEPLPPLKKNGDKYGLKGQIEHKIKFFEKYVPDDARVHLVGHSIGAYMILEMLDHPAVKDKIVDVELLHPTIEEMAKTPNGLFLTGFIRYLISLTCFLSLIFVYLPRFLKIFFLYVYTIIARVPFDINYRGLVDLVQPKILRRVFFLAYEEMDQVTKRNDDVIKRHIDKIHFVYGKTDTWTPRAYYERLQSDIPGVDVQITKINHAFVLTQNEEVADIVCELIKSRQKS